MKKEGFVFLAVFLSSLLIGFIGADLEITGYASSQPTNVSVFVVAGTGPVLNIVSPENKTYIVNDSLVLNYSVSGEESVWYNLDGGANITLTGNTIFNISEGQHILYLFANDSLGVEVSKNVTFDVDLDLFIVIYDEFKTSITYTNDFNHTAYEDLQDLYDIYLENENYCKIEFLEPINVPNDANNSDKVVNINENANISFNRIELNSTALPNFNKPATIWIYNLSFTNPRVLKNGVVCPSSICTIESYSGGILKFNVTGWSVYSAEETPIVPPTTGGGGGGVTKGVEGEFEVKNVLYEFGIAQNETLQDFLEITNLKTRSKEIQISVSDELKGILNLPSNIVLNSKETRILPFLLNPFSNAEVGLHLGVINLTDNNGNLIQVLMGVEVESAGAFLGVKISLPEDKDEFNAGDKIDVGVELFNLGDEPVRANIEYIIKDVYGNVIIGEEQTLIIQGSTEFDKTLVLPKSIDEGTYIVYVTANYGGKTAVSSKWFFVKNKRLKLIKLVAIISAIILGILILWIIFGSRRKAHSVAPKRKKAHPRKKKTDQIKKKLILRGNGNRVSRYVF